MQRKLADLREWKSPGEEVRCRRYKKEGKNMKDKKVFITKIKIKRTTKYKNNTRNMKNES